MRKWLMKILSVSVLPQLSQILEMLKTFCWGYSLFPYHTRYFPTILPVSLPFSEFLYHTPCFPTILPASLEYPTIPPVYYPTLSTICFPCDKLVAFNEMETLHTPIIRAQSHSSCMVVQFSLVRETHAQPSDKVV